MRGSEYGEHDRKAAILYEYETFKAIEGEQLLDTFLRYLQVINDLKKCGYKKDNYVNDALGYKKKAGVLNSDPLALVTEKTNVSKRKEKVVVSLDSEGSGADDFSELKKITALLAKAFNRRKFYSKPTNNNLRTSSASQSANKKQEFVKTNDKKEDKKADEKKRDMNKVKYYNCKKEGHFAKDCKKANVKDYNYYKTKMLLAKKDSDEQVLLAKDQAWMESISDSDQEINENMVFMAQIEKLEECVRNKDLEIEKCLKRLNDYENKLHKMGQTNQTVHMIMPSKDNLYNGRKGIGFENPSYFEKAKDLRPTLYDEKVIGLGYTLMFLTHSDEALEIEKFKRYGENKIEFAYDYGNLNASYVNEKINFEDDMDIFNLIRAPNPTKVKTGSRPRAPHEVPLLTLIASRFIEMDDLAATIDSSGVPSTIERSPLDFSLDTGASAQGTVAPEMPPSEDVPIIDVPEAGRAEKTAATDPPMASESRKIGRDGTDVNAPPKSLRRDHVDPRPDPDSLSVADPPSRHPADVAQSSQGTAAAGDPESKNTSSPVEVGSPESIYWPEWGVVNGSLLDTPEACQDLLYHVTPPGYFSKLCHLHNDEFLRRYNVNLAWQVAMGSQLCLRFEQEAKLLRKSVAQVARRDKRIQARELEIKNLEALLEAEANTKKATEDRSVELSQELENMHAQFLDLQVSNERLSQQVATLQQQVSGEEKLKAAFEEFKRQQDERVEQRCRRWVIGRGLRLVVMKCGESLELRQAFADAVSAGIAKGLSEGLRHGLEHGQAQLSLESIEAYDPEAEAKFVAALQALKDLKYPLVDQLESLKDTPMDVIMDALYLESDTGDDAPQDIRDLRPSSSQLTILVYPEVRDPQNPWACKEEIVLVDAIAANISRSEKKKKCRILCRTHGVGSTHHARFDGAPVSAPTVDPQGLALLLADAATQTELEDDT
uniref:CCHC-type domain-containing protein n=1 Tax=Tanacetum cinerariifolium TaxID=118510 RepID=A0A699HZD2_TANCI|nr:hypothetical protein [Tanacetum cinerariifolium]